MTVSVSWVLLWVALAVVSYSLVRTVTGKSDGLVLCIVALLLNILALLIG